MSYRQLTLEDIKRPFDILVGRGPVLIINNHGYNDGRSRHHKNNHGQGPGEQLVFEC